MIISASRRTDIPAYYSQWFVNRLQAGYVLTRNPMNHAQISRIPLSTDVVDCIVFWTKDPLHMLDKLPLLDEMGYRYYFQFTLNPYGRDIERNLRSVEERIETFVHLADSIGRDRVLWRYDPVILNEALTVDYHRDRFADMCRRLQDYTSVCTISFVDLYAKLDKAVKGGLIREIANAEMLQLASMFAEVAGESNIQLRACSESISLSDYGILPASCIDRETVEKTCGYTIASKADASQRLGCGCLQSIDIGAYNTCGHGCVYCYANYNEASVKRNRLKYDPWAELLADAVQANEKVSERKVKLLKKEQK